MGIIDGVTTNDLDEMLMQAHGFASWALNIVIKIPHGKSGWGSLLWRNQSP